MNEEKNTSILESVVNDLVSKMGFDCQVEVMREESDDAEKDNFICNISIKEDSNFLIGQYGINLQALQHISRLLIRRKTDEKIRFILDVNSYRQQKNLSIKELARSAAQQALDEKRAVIMKPMSAYERRLVHLELSKMDTVATESVGEGEGRKIIVKPVSEI